MVVIFCNYCKIKIELLNMLSFLQEPLDHNEGGKIVKITKLKLSVTNCFLVRTGDKYILVDTGYDWEWEVFCSRLKEVRVSFADISHIILTHHHDDHSGLLNNILTENPGIKLVMSRHAKNLLLKGKNDDTNGGGYLNKRVKILVNLKKKSEKKWTSSFPVFIVRKDDILLEKEVSLQDLGIGLDGKIIETPGHSVDSISVIFDDGDCIVGDAAANFLQFVGTKYCAIYIESMEEYYRSWRKIMDAGATRIHPAHGLFFGVDKLDKYINANSNSNIAMMS